MKIYKIILILIVFFSVSFSTFAASAEHQVMGGFWQEILILGEVHSKLENDSWLIKTIFVFPQTRKIFVFKNMKIRVNDLEKYWTKTGEFGLNDLEPIGVGQKYLLSLSKSKEIKGYDVQFNPIKVVGDNYWDMDVVASSNQQKKFSASWQVFINSGGKETIFSGDVNNVYWGKNVIFSEDCPSCEQDWLTELRNEEINNINDKKENYIFFTALLVLAIIIVIKKLKK